MFSRFSVCAAGLLAFSCCFPVIHPAAAEQQRAPIRLVSPMQGGKIIARNPDIQAIFTDEVDPDSLIIMLDDTDITGTAELTGKGFHCQVPMPLRAGNHNLYIAGNSSSGPFEQEIEFSSRQTAVLDQTVSEKPSVALTPA